MLEPDKIIAEADNMDLALVAADAKELKEPQKARQIK